MCTALNTGHLFGRTLDLEYSYGENIVCVPRRFHFDLLHEPSKSTHAAIIGVAHIHGGVPLFYDAINEFGLSAAALNFPRYAIYRKPDTKLTNLASFELIPWLLCRCSDLSSAVDMLKKINITYDSVDTSLPSTPLHWMIADRTGAVVAEPMHDGLKIYENPFGVMTNAPDFPYHINRLSEVMNVSPYPPKNRIFPSAELVSYSRGSGAFGTPGDFSSASRFIRAAFASAHTAHGKTKSDEISRFFHIMDTVAQPSGCAVTEEGKPISTVYTSCADTETATYYFTTYRCRRIRSVALKNAALDSDKLISYPMECREDILYL